MAWEQLSAIVQTNRDLAATERNTPPTNCPNDGVALLEGPDGQLYCPSDGWRPDGRYVN